jgi:hypothetical protein
MWKVKSGQCLLQRDYLVASWEVAPIVIAPSQILGIDKEYI